MTLLGAEETQTSTDSVHVRPTIAQWVEGLLLLGGFICLLWVGGVFGRAWVYQSYESYKLDQALKGRDASMSGYLTSVARHQDPVQPRKVFGGPETSGPNLLAKAIPVPPPAAKKIGDMIGRIEIDRLKISAIVREGVEDGTLSRAVGHVPYTPLPGQLGNVGIAAHRDTYFRGLRNVKKGDLIRIVTVEGTHEYQVDSTKIVRPENVEVLNQTSQAALTLITCYPFNYIGHAPKRFIVRALRVPTSS